MGNTTSCGYKTQTATGSVFSGMANGISGLVGLSSFWSPANDQGLKQAQNDFQDLKKQWEGIINQGMANLTKTQQDFAFQQQQLLIANQAFKDEVMDDKIETNTLLIQIIMGILLIVIIYLIIL